MRPLFLVPAHQAFLSHDLHELQHRGVSDRLDPLELLENFPHRGWAAVPEDLQYFELTVSGLGMVRDGHEMKIYEVIRIVNEKLRTSPVVRESATTRC